nr:hypothetical protein [Candidatus Cloacimonadota bacterium]
MKKYIIHGADILSFDPARPYLSDNALMVENGKIVKIAPYGDLKDKNCEYVDASGKILMPGLINAHHHFYSTMITGLGKAAPAANFEEVLRNLWWRLDKKLSLRDIYVSSAISAIDAIRKGTTSVIDHHASPSAISGSLLQIALAVKETGIRASLCYEVSDRDGFSIRDEGIQENLEFISEYGSGQDDYLKALFGMHAAFTLGDDSLSKISKAVHALNCGVHIHAAESDSDQRYNLEHYGKRVVERLVDFDLLNSQSILAHGVHLTPKELRMVADSGAAIVTNPQSNLNNAVGIADVCEMVKQGVTVGLGTDAMTMNMLQELRVGLWAQHLKQENPSAGFMEIASTLLFNNPIIAQKYWGTGHGMLTEGANADMILVDYDPHTPLNSETWIGHLINGISQARVDSTIVGGEFLMWGGELLLGLDERELRAESRSLSQALWERF